MLMTPRALRVKSGKETGPSKLLQRLLANSWPCACSSSLFVSKVANKTTENNDVLMFKIQAELSASGKRFSLRHNLVSREDKGDREGIPHTHPIP